MPSPPRKTALLIGNGVFDDPKLSTLTAPSADVDGLGNLLRDPLIGGFDEVVLLRDEKFGDVSAAIGRLFNDNSREDTILLYYSGHGLPDGKGHLYLATKDTTAATPAGNAIASAEIKRWMGDSRSRRQVIVLDCCYSGSFGAAKDGTVVPIGAETFKTQGFGQHVLTASRSVERAYEGKQEIEDIETSLFTHFLIHGLETGEAAPEGEDSITVRDLYNHAYNGVVGHIDKMRPQMWVDEGEGELVIARNPKPYRLPDELERMLLSEDPYDREGAVRILGGWLRGPKRKERVVAAKTLANLDKTERNRQVGDALSEVLLLPAATDEPTATDESPATEEPFATDERPAIDAPVPPSPAVRVVPHRGRLWSIAPVAFALVIGALAAAIGIAPQITTADRRVSAVEETLEEVQAVLESVTRERSEARRVAEDLRRTAVQDKAMHAEQVSKLTHELDSLRDHIDQLTVQLQNEKANSENLRRALDSARERMMWLESSPGLPGPTLQ